MTTEIDINIFMASIGLILCLIIVFVDITPNEDLIDEAQQQQQQGFITWAKGLATIVSLLCAAILTTLIGVKYDVLKI